MIGKFWDALKALPPGRVRLLECGTRHTAGTPPSSRREEAVALRRDLTHTGLDLAPGPGVDVVADLHDLTALAAGPPFDAALLCSVLEHVRRPWEAARQLARVVRPGGLLYCQSHFLFPKHSYPNDYSRFSADGLREVFSRDVGWAAIDTGEEYPALVVPLTNAWAHGAKGWNFEPEKGHLNSWILCERL
jgi:SAM-dependent methyltransferase